jgi:hypothetical protein
MSASIDQQLVATIPGWFQPPRGLQEVVACYGQITVVNYNVVTPGWESANMVSCGGGHPGDPPPLPGIPGGRLYVNRKIEPMLRSALAEVAQRSAEYPIIHIGCFSPRAKRVNGDLSAHSWGIAVDVNPDTNPLQTLVVVSTNTGAKRLGPVIRDIPDWFLDAFCRRGFMSGLDFQGRKDPMHLQYCEGY